jgi:putative addiction module component (TIGR02574 family)
MTAVTRQLAKAALKLPVAERESLARKIWRSLEFKSQKEWEAAWYPEIKHRVDAYRNGSDPGKPAGEIFARLAKRYSSTR